MDRELRSLLTGLCFPEGPRWRDGRLHVSDMHANRVISIDLDGNFQTVAEVPHNPSGLGWLPDGRILVVSMTDRKVLRLDPEGLTEHADLSKLADFHCNDMVVDALGRAYVGNFGFDFQAGAAPRGTALVLVQPDGECHVVAEDLAFPNGAVITPDGRTLILAETYGARLTAFDIADDGTLTNRRTHAELPSLAPDGICLDAEGGIWVAAPFSHSVIRVLEGGTITDRIPVRTESFACALGGDDQRTLFVCTATTTEPSECRAVRKGAIEFAKVDVPGAGLS
ncbi:SMP-30/gluconolactonase/LRE family protein [Myxococcota bacterium]|nr:SMP-30/gluconolactonase/LRE family protein [Myxococcota bacterium]